MPLPAIRPNMPGTWCVHCSSFPCSTVALRARPSPTCSVPVCGRCVTDSSAAPMTNWRARWWTTRARRGHSIDRWRTVPDDARSDADLRRLSAGRALRNGEGSLSDRLSWPRTMPQRFATSAQVTFAGRR